MPPPTRDTKIWNPTRDVSGRGAITRPLLPESSAPDPQVWIGSGSVGSHQRGPYWVADNMCWVGIPVSVYSGWAPARIHENRVDSAPPTHSATRTHTHWRKISPTHTYTHITHSHRWNLSSWSLCLSHSNTYTRTHTHTHTHTHTQFVCTPSSKYATSQASSGVQRTLSVLKHRENTPGLWFPKTVVLHSHFCSAVLVILDSFKPPLWILRVLHFWWNSCNREPGHQ